MIIGYARVSTDGQTLDAQQAALLFSEKVSGAKTDRAQLARALATLPSGDTLVVCKLDRLARSTRDLLNTLAANSDKGRELQVAWGSVGRYNDRSWSPDAYSLRWPC
jgi:DNA invertase Pin-like site-specific DNA recombinase